MQKPLQTADLIAPAGARRRAGSRRVFSALRGHLGETLRRRVAYLAEPRPRRGCAAGRLRENLEPSCELRSGQGLADHVDGDHRPQPRHRRGAAAGAGFDRGRAAGARRAGRRAQSARRGTAERGAAAGCRTVCRDWKPSGARSCCSPTTPASAGMRSPSGSGIPSERSRSGCTAAWRNSESVSVHERTRTSTCSPPSMRSARSPPPSGRPSPCARAVSLHSPPP